MYINSDRDNLRDLDDSEFGENEIARLASFHEDALYDEDGNMLKDAEDLLNNNEDLLEDFN
jgi:hypothetical protein